MVYKSSIIKHITTDKCRVKAAKWFPKAATNPKLASNEDLPAMEAASHNVNDRVVKEPELEGKPMRLFAY